MFSSLARFLEMPMFKSATTAQKAVALASGGAVFYSIYAYTTNYFPPPATTEADYFFKHQPTQWPIKYVNPVYSIHDPVVVPSKDQ